GTGTATAIRKTGGSELQYSWVLSCGAVFMSRSRHQVESNTDVFQQAGNALQQQQESGHRNSCLDRPDVGVPGRERGFPGLDGIPGHGSAEIQHRADEQEKQYRRENVDDG